MSRLGRSLAAIVSATLIASVLSASAAPTAAEDTSPVGAAGIGDPYFPKYGNGGYRVVSYDITAGYTGKTRRLRGDTTIVARASKRLKRFNLDLLLRASSVRVNGERARFRQTRHELVVTPRKALRDGQRMRVRVRYAGRPGPIRYGGERPFLAGRHSALAVGQPNIAPWWFPSNDHPSDRARFRVTLRAPKGQQTISNGRLIGKRTSHGRTTWRWRTKQPMATYLAFAAWGDYQIDRGRTASGRPYLYAYDRRMRPDVTRAAKRSIRSTGRVTDFLAKRWGRYPYGQIGGVATASPLGYALENQTRPVYDQGFFGGSSTSSGIIAHEMAHQWFGDAVTVKRWKDIWLNEGYATYSEWIWSARHGGPRLDKNFKNWHSTPAGDSFWKVPLRDPGKRRIFHDAIYYRGAMTLHALRRKIGFKDFFTLSRRWVHRNDGVGGQREYSRLAENVSGKELGPFFRSWLRAGKPEA